MAPRGRPPPDTAPDALSMPTYTPTPAPIKPAPMTMTPADSTAPPPVPSGASAKGSLSALKDGLRNMAEGLSRLDQVLVVSHLDADGISAGSIMLSALLEAGANPQVKIVKQLDGNVIKEAAQLPHTFVVFTDMGSGQKQLLKALGKPFAIIDHHQPELLDHPLEANPHLYGFDGSNELSAAGMAYLVASEMDSRNRRLAPLAIIGALGDMQDKGERSSLVGLNAEIAAQAEKDGLLIVRKGLKLYGFESRPLVKSMEYTITPYLPGLSGDEGACFKFLKGLGIDPRKPDGSWKSVSDLSAVELRSVINGTIKYLISHGLESREVEQIVGTIYVLAEEERETPLRDAREFSAALNACGRMGRAGLGVSICMGDRGRALDELREVLQGYRRTISGYLDWLSKNKEAVRVLPEIQAVYGGSVIDEKMIGTVVSIAYSMPPLSMDRAVVGFANCSEEPGVVKVSARGTAGLVSRGLNLGLVMKEASERVGGVGGGHDIAAGAQIPRGREDEFLSAANEIIRCMVGART